MKRTLLLILLAVAAWSAMACTAVVVSGKATADGRPMIFKHRDTEDQRNSVRYFVGERYAFIGLVNSDSPAGEVWTGTNAAGFCIINTAAYNFREDTLSSVVMDREGEVMYRALSLCATVADFQLLLDTCSKPLGVETNFGVIDAQGGAAWFEVNNFRYVKYDVNALPEGYRVVTNFCVAGRREDYAGWDRYLIASDVMRREFTPAADHRFFFNRLSRNTTQLNGNSIPRNITSASLVIEGVRPGTSPLNTVMWTILGNPLNHIAVPLQVSHHSEARMRRPGLNLKKEERIRRRFLKRQH